MCCLRSAAQQIIGGILGLLLVFRTNSSYNRFDEVPPAARRPGRPAAAAAARQSRARTRRAGAGATGQPNIIEHYRTVSIIVGALADGWTATGSAAASIYAFPLPGLFGLGLIAPQMRRKCDRSAPRLLRPGPRTGSQDLGFAGESHAGHHAAGRRVRPQ